LTLVLNRVLEIVKVHVCAKFYQAKISGLCAIVLTEKKRKILSDIAENNTAVPQS